MRRGLIILSLSKDRLSPNGIRVEGLRRLEHAHTHRREHLALTLGPTRGHDGTSSIDKRITHASSRWPLAAG